MSAPSFPPHLETNPPLAGDSILAFEAIDAPPPTPPNFEMNPAEWSYLAEGGFHIILRYDGGDANLEGKILRIAHTAEAVHSAARPGDADTTRTPDVSGEPALDQAGARRRFERDVLVPLLGEQYVQPGDAVTLSKDDIRSIHQSIDHLRPDGRIRSDPGNWSTAAHLEPDKTGFWLRLPGISADTPTTTTTTIATAIMTTAMTMTATTTSTTTTTNPSDHDEKAVVIAVEIKPKGAVMPVGALVPPGPNRLKYRVDRFDAQQKFKAQVKQNWGAIDRPTGYHPRELYSRDAERAAATLKELMKTPQNKLRAWENGVMLFGAGSGGEGPVADAAGAHLLGLAVERADLSAGGGTPAEDLMDLVGELLAREPLISRMHAAQALDVLEVEGAGLVFDRLVSLYGGSKEAALALLKRREAEPFVAEQVTPELLLPEATLSSLREASLESLKAGTAVEGMDELYQKALKAVEKLSEEECVQLLRRYIIALGVMDCSVMMSLKAVPQSAAGSTTATIQGHGAAGVFKTRNGRMVAYCVSVVDAGPKPPTKLGGKAKDESRIWEFVASLEEKELLGCTASEMP